MLFPRAFRFVGSLLMVTAALVSPCLGQGSRGLVTFGKPTNPASDTLYLDPNQDLANQLLPFDDIFKIALANSPSIRYQDQIVNGQKAAYEVSRRQVLQNVAGSGNYSFGNQTLNSTGTANTGTNGNTFQLSNGFRVGVDARVSLYDLFGRKYQLQQVQANLKATELQKNVTALQLRRELIEIFQDMLTSQQILKIRLLDEQTSLSAYRVAEVDLRRGQLTADAMANITNRYVEAKAVSEQIKGEFLKRVYVFESIVGVPIHKLRRY